MPKIVATKDQWTKLGYQLFAEMGIRGLNVEKMSNVLKCNRSSFYWHFRTKKEFIDEVINFWIRTETEQVISKVEQFKTPRERLSAFLEIAFRHEPYLEFIFFLKRYSKKNEKIQVIIDRVDDRRLEFSANLFQDVGYSKKEASVKASIFYKYLIGHHEMIRNKKQPKNYLSFVKKELKHFLDI